jgi:putative transposase
MSERRELEFEGAASPAEVAETLCRIADGIRQRALSVSLGEAEITVYPDGDLALEIQADHVHLFFSAPPAIAPSLAIQWFKGISARTLFAEFPALRASLRKGHLWAPSFYVGTAGNVAAATIQRYIERTEHITSRR